MTAYREGSLWAKSDPYDVRVVSGNDVVARYLAGTVECVGKGYEAKWVLTTYDGLKEYSALEYVVYIYDTGSVYIEYLGCLSG